MIATESLLQEGIAAARAGDRARARALLMQLVESDERNEQGWLWLAGVMDDPEEMRVCLQNVLALNPSNARARQGLAWIESRHGSGAKDEARGPKDHGAPAAHARQAPQAPAARPAPSPSPAAAVRAAADAPTVTVAAAPAAPTPAMPATSVAPTVAAAAAPPAPAPAPKPTAGFPAPAAATVVLPETAAERRAAKPGRETWAEKRAKAEAERRAKAEAKAAARAEAKAKAEAERRAKAEAKAAARAEAKAKAEAERRAKAEAKAAAKAAALAKVEAERQAKADAKAKLRPGARDLATPDVTEAEAACPYCGVMNDMERTWCAGCERGLMVRSAVDPQPSIWLKLFSGLWLLGGVLSLLGVLAALVVTLGAFAMAKSTPAGDDVPFPFDVMAAVVFGGMLAFGQIMVARELGDRQRWAYGLLGGVALLNLAGAIVGAAIGGAFLADAIAQIDPKQLPEGAQGSVDALVGLIGTILLVSIGFHALFVLLGALCWRDFFGQKVRFIPEVKGSDDVECYNIGLACKSRKMWFMAMRQWEAAARKAPRDPQYLHALGLAYVQLQYFDQARETLERAAKADPKSEPIRLSLARVEQRLAAR